MRTFLTANDSTIEKRFHSLTTLHDIAVMLEIDPKVLIYYLYRRTPDSNYTRFRLPKRSGGYREILAPVSSLKILQRKLNYILQLIYRPKNCVHGFARERSIVTNAKVHLRKACVFNVDLEDFFPSINYGRVYGMFQARPYQLPQRVATILAQLCCYRNHIPQGAPTSPIISNMICSKLDGELQRFARIIRCNYTRYADDITFSTTLDQFSEDLIKETADGLILGDALVRHIETNGFSINRAKVRLQRSNRHQEVTGITVNKTPNVNRRYVRQLRAMIYAWQKYGYNSAQREHQERYRTRRRNPNRPPVNFSNVVAGKLNYLRMVRGAEAPVYQRLAYKYYQLIGVPFPKYYESIEDAVIENVWILECEETGWQGTAFMLYGVGLITCQHVLNERTRAFRAINTKKKFPIVVKREDRNIDLAILEIVANKSPGLKQNAALEMSQGMPAKIVGFSNYRRGDTCSIVDSQIVSFRKAFDVDRIQVAHGIIYGMSGGPVFNSDREVIGVAVSGAKEPASEPDIANFGVIPIRELQNLSD